MNTIGHPHGQRPGVLIVPRCDRPGVTIHYMTAQKIKKPGRSAARADWKFMGAEVPPNVFEAAVAEARENGVPQAVVIRWALESYLSDRLEAAK